MWRLMTASGRREDGFSVAELTVSAALMAIVVAISLTALTTDLFALGDAEKESEAVDDLRLAFAQVERDVRSADCIFAPDAAAANPATGATLDLHTYAGGTGASVLWQVNPSRELTRTEGPATRVLATNVSSVAFTHHAPDLSNVNEAQKSRVDITVTRATGARSDSERYVTTTVTARNASVVPSGNPRKCTP